MQVGGLMSERLWHPKKWMMRVVLWLLSSWIGTFIICGIPSLSTKFPYFQNFPEVSQKQREKILLSWSHSIFYHLRMLFKTLKLLVLFVYFSQVGILLYCILPFCLLFSFKENCLECFCFFFDEIWKFIDII